MKKIIGTLLVLLSIPMSVNADATTTHSQSNASASMPGLEEKNLSIFFTLLHLRLLAKSKKRMEEIIQNPSILVPPTKEEAPFTHFLSPMKYALLALAASKYLEKESQHNKTLGTIACNNTIGYSEELQDILKQRYLPTQLTGLTNEEQVLISKIKEHYAKGKNFLEESDQQLQRSKKFYEQYKANLNSHAAEYFYGLFNPVDGLIS